MKPRYVLVKADPDSLLFENMNPSNWFSRELYRLERWRWNCMAKGYWPGVPA